MSRIQPRHYTDTLEHCLLNNKWMKSDYSIIPIPDMHTIHLVNSINICNTKPEARGEYTPHFKTLLHRELLTRDEQEVQEAKATALRREMMRNTGD